MLPFSSGVTKDNKPIYDVTSIWIQVNDVVYKADEGQKWNFQ